MRYRRLRRPNAPRFLRFALSLGVGAAGSLAAAVVTAEDAKAPQDLFAAPSLVLPGAYKPPSSKISLALEDADLSELLRSIGNVTGKRFIVPNPKLRSLKASLYAPEQVTVDEAYQALLAVLHANGLTVLPKGAFFEVVEANDAARHGPPLSLRLADLPAEERFVTHLHRLSYLAAEDVAASVLAKLQSKDGSVIAYGNLLMITDAAPNVRRMLRILEEVDVGGAEDHLYLQPLHYQPAADLEKRLKDLFEMKAGASAPPAGKGAPAPAPGHGPAVEAPGATRITKLVAVDRPNALLIVAPEAAYLRLLEVVRRLDVPPEEDAQVHVISLQHVDAKKVIEPLNGILQSTGASRPAGTAAQAPGGEGAIRATADEGNNAILVHCSRRDYPMVFELVRKLDQPRRQVYIEAVILDLTSVKSTSLDVSYHGGAGLGGAALAAGGFNPLASIGGLSAAGAGGAGIQALALGVSGAAIPGLSKAIGE